VLSGIYYASISFLRDGGWNSPVAPLGNYPTKVTLWDIAKFATASDTEPRCEE
jgi:hypothetical protein